MNLGLSHDFKWLQNQANVVLCLLIDVITNVRVNVTNVMYKHYDLMHSIRTKHILKIYRLFRVQIMVCGKYPN